MTLNPTIHSILWYNSAGFVQVTNFLPSLAYLHAQLLLQKYSEIQIRTLIIDKLVENVSNSNALNPEYIRFMVGVPVKRLSSREK